jgi:hypothetical protein
MTEGTHHTIYVDAHALITTVEAETSPRRRREFGTQYRTLLNLGLASVLGEAMQAGHQIVFVARDIGLAQGLLAKVAENFPQNMRRESAGGFEIIPKFICWQDSSLREKSLFIVVSDKPLNVINEEFRTEPQHFISTTSTTAAADFLHQLEAILGPLTAPEVATGAVQKQRLLEPRAP